ncbi:MAG: M20/M25/M40 family metallo-hydrolase [Thermomicrobiales bacterium]|nr:M20/M25/M40 family metallo-hydrolase [Thermomicrobiales bacterium]
MSARERVCAAVDARRDEIVDLLADLVRFPSVNRRPYGDELACQEFVADRYARMGLEIDRFRPDEIPGIEAHPGWAQGSDFADRPNIVGTRRGVGGGRSLLLLSHVDVVPEGPHELWRHGPFNPTIEGDELVGRGTNDDKGGLAAQTMALACVEAAGYRVKGDVILASVVDEESGGANGTLAVLHRPHLADGAVYCDGLDLDVAIANLGGINARIDIQLEPTCAGGVIGAVLPVTLAVYQELERFAEERTAAIRNDPRYAETVWPEYAVRIGYLQAGSEDGGNPGGSRIDVSTYILPGEEPMAVFAGLERRIVALRDGFPNLRSISIAPVGRVMPPSAIDPADPFVGAVAAAYETATGQAARRRGMPMSDYFQFMLHSPKPIPTVAMGPGRWAVPGAAHEANESILIDEHLIPFVKTLALLIVDWCGVEPAE